jgi:hypothetical protein
MLLRLSRYVTVDIPDLERTPGNSSSAEIGNVCPDDVYPRVLSTDGRYSGQGAVAQTARRVEGNLLVLSKI